ncbi:hypothetical protein MPRS_30610 [Mycobacterium paraseoulense]|nr:hypothetical protein MPRS_30610 [Mycobacterium paraseoulense]
MNHFVEMPDVAYHAVCVEFLGAQVVYCLLQAGLIDVGEHHAGAPAGEFGGRRQTDTTRTARDDRSATFKPVHGTELYFKQLPASIGRVTPVM